jgi:hypothetical protein
LDARGAGKAKCCARAHWLYKAAEAFPKVAGLKLRESIEIIVGELDKLGVCGESDLEFLPDKIFEKLSLTPVSQVKMKKLATMMRESLPAVVQPEPPAARGVYIHIYI